MELRGTLDSYSAYYAMNGTWWNLAATASPGFDTSRSFAELWVQPAPAGRFRFDDGDDPATPTYERFDPLFWGNGPDNWWFGANGAYSWLNANLRAQRFIVDAYLSAQDIVQLQYVRASVDQLNSAVQFGQGARFTGNQLVVGVPEPGLSNEVYLQYSRVFNPQAVATAFVSRSSPRDGLEAVSPQGTLP